MLQYLSSQTVYVLSSDPVLRKPCVCMHCLMEFEVCFDIHEGMAHMARLHVPP